MTKYELAQKVWETLCGYTTTAYRNELLVPVNDWGAGAIIDECQRILELETGSSSTDADMVTYCAAAGMVRERREKIRSLLDKGMVFWAETIYNSKNWRPES